MSFAHLSRRSLLKAGGALGGGLFLSFHLPAAHAESRVPSDFKPNAWLTITPEDRYLFYLDRSEMGQGVMTALPMILAEELEVEPSRLEVQFALAERRYDNPKMGMQVTGGSTSVAAGWTPLREAGATAREMLRKAAARRWEVPLSECDADNGTIVHRPSQRRLHYGELADEASRVSVAKPALKPARDFKYLGKPRGRVDAQAKSFGKAQFGIDVSVPNMLTAVVVRCPVFGGKVKSFDASEAQKLSGVVKVVAIPHGVGVVAKSYWQARRAAGALKVEWDEGPLATLSSAQIRDQYLKACTEGPLAVVRKDGEGTRGLSSAAKILEATYEAPFLSHATMEPMNCTAHVQKDSCEIWAPTQAQGGSREVAARLLDLPQEKVVVHTTLMGGGFGRRGNVDFVEEAVLLSKEVGQPVKVVWSREDDVRHGQYRPASLHLMRAGLDEHGNVVGWHHRLASQSILRQLLPKMAGAALPNGFPNWGKDLMGNMLAGMLGEKDPTSIEAAATFAYELPHTLVEYSAVEPGIPVTFWRSVAHSFNAFVVESFIDECAHAAGKDPFAYRRELLKFKHRERWVLELAAEKAGWGTPLPEGHFRGIAQNESFGSYVGAVAEVSVEGEQIRVHRVVMAIDCGQTVNPDLITAQMEGSVMYGLSAALKQRITLTNGRVDQSNFHDYPVVRMNEAPKVETHIRFNEAAPGGVGEPGVPVIAPAVANAVFAATGKRLRSLPLSLSEAQSSGSGMTSSSSGSK